MNQNKFDTKNKLNRLETNAKSILFFLRNRQLERQSTSIADIANILDFTKEIVLDALKELKNLDIIAYNNPNNEFETIELTEIGIWLIEHVLIAPYSYKQIIQAIFFVRSCEDNIIPLLYRDFKKIMYENARIKGSRFANVLNELKRNDLVKIYRVIYKGLKNPRKAVRLTKLGKLITTQLLYKTLNPIELRLFCLFNALSQEKKQEVIKYLLQQNKK